VKQHARFAQRVERQQVVALGRVQPRGFCVAMLEQGNDVGLGGIFDGDVHG